jgi:hypothetical protein
MRERSKKHENSKKGRIGKPSLEGGEARLRKVPRRGAL